MDKRLRIALPAIGIIIILLLIVFVLDRSSRPQDEFDFQKIPTCAKIAIGINSSLDTIDKTTDLDPSIPINSKALYTIRHKDGTIEEIFYSIDEQVVRYLQSLKDDFCILNGFPPTCMMGHEPPRLVNGTPQIVSPSGPTCTVPTSSNSTSPVATKTLSCDLHQPGFNSFVLLTPYPTDAIIMDNVGSVCFYKDSPIIHAQVYPPRDECFSTSCSKIFERVGDMKVNQEEHIIQFSSRFIAQQFVVKGCECTADCGGAGLIQFDIQSIPDGTYAIRLGNTEIGQVQFPLTDNFVCTNNR